MKRICKSKKGFTLVEMVLVIAIIAILTVGIVAGIAYYIKYAETARDKVMSHNDATSKVTSTVSKFF